uniref:Uncharacterized protein n=1 Tax=Chenopodium quinoa TaxID=63459 RepID=A0A803MRG6_CHEQI
MGVFIRSSDNKEEMPLHLAIKNNEFGTVKFLLENLDELKGWWNILDYNMRIVPDLLAITQDIPRWFLDFFSSKFSELPNELAWTAGRSLYGIHKKEIKEHMSSLGLVAALLTTLTFTAAFTLPRGSNDENGTPVLAKKVMFKEMSKISLADMQNPLYLHPRDGQHFVSMEKLTGEGNCREWRRSMEINLASKRKLGFVTGPIKKDTGDDVKANQWDTCNRMVIAWFTSNMTDIVKKSIIMFLDFGSEIWIA